MTIRQVSAFPRGNGWRSCRRLGPREDAEAPEKEMSETHKSERSSETPTHRSTCGHTMDRGRVNMLVNKDGDMISCFDCGEHLCARRLDGLTCPCCDLGKGDDERARLKK